MTHVSILTKDCDLKWTALSPTEFGCPLCPKFITKTESVINRHIKNHAFNAVHFQEKMICRCNLSCRDKSHFHCPFCATTIILKLNMKAHLTECQQKFDEVQRSSKPSSQETHPTVRDLQGDRTPSPPPSPPSSNSLPPESALIPDHSYSLTASTKTPKDSVQPSSHVRCPHCSIILYQKNLLLHIKRKHTEITDVIAESHLKGTCVDKINGLYAVRKTARGFSVPLHVQRKAQGQQHITRCESGECQQYHQLAQSSGLFHSICHHIRSLHYCRTNAREEPLQNEVLQEMVDNHFFGEAKADLCRKKKEEAEKAHVPLSVLVDLGGSKNHMCLSIYEPDLHHFSTLGRVMVTYNLQKNTWHCPCAKTCMSCPHKYIAKWHLFQTHKSLFTAAPPTKTPQVTTTHPVSPTTAGMERTVRYLYECKKIPATLPEETTAHRALTEYPQQLFPKETKCKMCPDGPELEEAVQITDEARIVGMEGVMQNVSTYRKRCPTCGVVYRYQEWRDGLHNFNNHVILTLRLCLYLRHNLQNHVSVSHVIRSLESLLKKKFPAPSLIFQGYCQFEALCNTAYKYSCVNCGFDPPVMVMDLHRKGVFDFEVNELEQPKDDLHCEHNTAAFWESVRLHMISRGVFESSSQNPFVKPTYEKWTRNPPVFRLKRKAEQDVEGTMAERASDNERLCMADPMKFCIFQTSQNTGLRLLYPDAESLEWVQCQMCRSWLHKDCAGKCRTDTFNCGCTNTNDRPSKMEAVEKGGILAVFSKDQIKRLYDDLHNGTVRSNRMFLWKNPSASLSLKQHLKLRTLSLSDQRVFELLRVIEEVTGVGAQINTGEKRLHDFVFDVMLPEILIQLLEEQGMNRLRAEITLATIDIF